MPQIGYAKALARACRESYYEFFKEFWSSVAEEKFRPNWHIEKLCNELQDVAERVFRNEPKKYDLAWNCPPGTTKSKVASVLWHPWIWTRMPSARMLSGSYSERIALDLARQSRDCVRHEKYRDLFGIELRDDQDTKGYYMNTQGGWRFTTGVGGTATGMHAHFICIDDPIDPLSAMSDILINEANIWINETLGDRKVEKWLVPTVLIMQRLHQDDPTGNWLSSGRRVKHVALPADDSYPIIPIEMAQYYQNGLLDPTRLPQDVLDEAFKRGEAYYAGQYGQQPVPRGGLMFKVDQLHFNPRVPEKWKRGPVRHWDKAASLKKRAAFTVGVKMAIDLNDMVWILDVKRGRWNSADREKMIQTTAVSDGKKTTISLEQEPGSGGLDSVEATKAALTKMGFKVIIDKPTGDKITRADNFSVQVNGGNVTCVTAMWNKDYVDELRFFPNSKFKDQTDSSSGCYGQLGVKRLRIGALAG